MLTEAVQKKPLGLDRTLMLQETTSDKGLLPGQCWLRDVMTNPILKITESENGLGWKGP